jgi:hypothetical protein
MMWSAALVAIAAVGGPNHPETVVNITIPNNYLNRFLRAFCALPLCPMILLSVRPSRAQALSFVERALCILSFPLICMDGG